MYNQWQEQCEKSQRARRATDDLSHRIRVDARGATSARKRWRRAAGLLVQAWSLRWPWHRRTHARCPRPRNICPDRQLVRPLLCRRPPQPARAAARPAPTPFQARVREAMLAIPYGSTATYGNIAAAIEHKTGARQSARAVGGAVGHNPLCIIVPCHRVMGPHDNLTGFGGGIDAKVALLAHEGALRDSFTRPTHGTAL
nr:MGMT family protein [uncultured Parolsenella sp.]